MPKNMITPEGDSVVIPDHEVDAAIIAGYRIETSPEAANRAASAQITADNTTLRAQVKAGVQATLRGASLGLTDALQVAIGDDETARELRQLRESNPGISTGFEIAGAVAPALLSGGSSVAGSAARALPSGAAAAFGARIARAGEGAGTISRIGRAAAGAGAEGAIVGLGQGVSELALSEEPVNIERAVSTLTSRALYGAAIGAGAGTLAKGAEIGLAKGRAALDEVAARYSARGAIGDDLAALDAKGLRVAEQAEREVIEQARVVQRKELAEEISSFRRELKAQKQFLTTKDVDLPAVGEKLGAKELGRIAAKANKQLDNVLDNPTGLMKNPAKALDALQRQENALAKLADRADDLRAIFATDTSGARTAALDTIAPALERNRALQARLADITADASSPRLTQIAEARELLAAGGAPESFVGKMAGGVVFGGVAGAVADTGLPGSGMLAPLLGAAAAGTISGKVFGRLGKAMGERLSRNAAAIDKVFAAGTRAVRAAPPVATRVLAAVAFAPERSETAPAGKRLPELYKQRSTEIREQVAASPVGKPVVRPAARARIAAALAPVAAFQPLLADRMESLAVKRLEFLADRLPKRPEIGGLQIGPDRWSPSEMEMRGWARLVAAVEDPEGVLERVADGTVTLEDAEVMREVYPEMLAEFTAQVLTRLPDLRATLPYHRRLALSTLTGVPVDPSMDPRILAALQAPYADASEPPTPKPAFGSVTNTEVGTPSERRQARE